MPDDDDCPGLIERSEKDYLHYNLCKGNKDCVDLVLAFVPPKGIHANDLNNPYLSAPLSLGITEG